LLRLLLLELLFSPMAGAAPGGPTFGFVPIALTGEAQAMALDASGNTYIASTIEGRGICWLIAFTADGEILYEAYPCHHIVVAKFDPAGKVVYSLPIGGSSEDWVKGIVVDGAGRAWITGYTYSPDFPVTPSAAQKTFAGPTLQVTTSEPSPGGDVFIAAVNADGSGLAYSTYWGGEGNDYPNAIALDRSGNLYIAGYSDSGDFPTTSAAYRRSGGLGFLLRLTTGGSGASAVYSTRFDQAIQLIATDNYGFAYVVGSASASAPVPVTAGAFQSTAQGGADVFVAKFDPRGSWLLYSTYLGGSGYDIADSVAVDPDGNVYISGATDSNNFPVTTGTAATGNAFLTKLNSAGSNLVFSMKLDWPGFYPQGRLFLDSSSNAYYFGQTTSVAGLPATEGGLRRASCLGDLVDVSPLAWEGYPFLARFAPSGDLDFLSYLTPWQRGAGPSTFEPARGKLVALTHLGPGIGSMEIAASAPVPPRALYCAVNAVWSTGLDSWFGDSWLGYISPSFSVAPGEVVTLWGDNFGPEIPVAGVPSPDGRMPQTLGGVQVLIDGIASPLLYVSENQINAVTPFALAPGTTVQAQVEYSGESSDPLPLDVGDTDFLVFRSTDSSRLPLVINQDGTLNSEANPAEPGSAVAVWATGLGQTVPPSLDGVISSYPLPRLAAEVGVVCGPPGGLEELVVVEYAGAAPTLVAGMSQINFRVPPDAPAGQNWCDIDAWSAANSYFLESDQVWVWTN
jgi:uncharacterized protein (TIGR03437 family)